MNSFVNRLFTEISFDQEFPLVANIDGVQGKNIPIPEGIRYNAYILYMYHLSSILIILLVFFFCRREQFLQWVEGLPHSQTPSWLGLPNNAEKVLLANRGSMLTAKLLKMQSLSDDEDFMSIVSTTVT